MTGPQFVEELQKAWHNENAVLPIDLRWPARAQHDLLTVMGAAAVVDHTGRHTELSNARPVAEGDALVIATSGTSGEPKGVVHTHDSIRASAIRTSQALEVTPQDHWLACLPLAHIGGLSVVMRSIITQTPLTVLPEFDAPLVDEAGRNGVTLVSLVTAALNRVDTTLFRKILLGGAAPPSTRPPNTVTTYGMTETGSGIVYDRKPLRDVEIRIDESNEIHVKSPTLFRCYRDGNDPKIDGWFATGDSGAFDNGLLTVHGRMNDVINTGGEKVWPQTVEEVLRKLHSISEVRIYGKDDPDWGQTVVAELEVNGNAPSLEDVREFVKQTLPAYCAPRAIQIVEKISRTSNGKVRRH